MAQPNSWLNQWRKIAFRLAALVATLPCWAQQNSKPLPPGIMLVDITAKAHLLLPALKDPPTLQTLQTRVSASEYSLDFARKILLPAIGGSVAVDAVDDPDFPDLYVTVPGSSNHLFHNLRNGTFRETTSKAGVPGTGYDLSATFADYDHSGHASLFVAGLDGITLYHNNGNGTFRDITEKSGIKKTPGELATSALLFDAEGNGRLDLLITAYTDLTKPPAKPTFLFPNSFDSLTSHLYQNLGDGRFREITQESGLGENPGRTQKALAADFSHTGRFDLLLLRDNKPPVLFRNKGHASFEDRTWEAGKENWRYAYLDGQLADFNRDGKVDVALWSTIGNEVIINEGDGKFQEDEAIPVIIGANRAFGFHGLTADFKGDGYDDLLIADNNGEWHYIANHRGQFALASITLPPNTGKKRENGKSELPQLASLIPVHIDQSRRVTLIGMRMDGRLIALEVQAAQTQPIPRKGKTTTR
jgi:FG-GAP-like repeat